MINKKLLISVTVIALLALGGCTALNAAGSVNSPTQAATSQNNSTTVNQPAVSLTNQQEQAVALVQDTYRTLYENVNPSVVNIQITETQGPNVISGEGSGFVWDTQGHIVTNDHVVDGATNITVVFSDGTTVNAKVVGKDPRSDLAVIQVDPTKVNLVPVKMGDSSKVMVGDLVIAIGNPYGLSGTMTQGIVSALSRSLPSDQTDPNSQTTYTIPDIIQTDAAINPGNSGGVLVNVNGEVIGVTAAIQSSTNSNAGIGFVIPSHIVEKVVPVLIKSGKYAHPNMGISGVTMNPSIASDMKIDPSTTGVLITGVVQGSPAEKAGLIPSTQQMSGGGRVIVTYGDVITAIDGHQIRTFEDLASYLFNNTDVGQKITLTVLRDGKQVSVDLTLGTAG